MHDDDKPGVLVDSPIPEDAHLNLGYLDNRRATQHAKNEGIKIFNIILILAARARARSVSEDIHLTKHKEDEKQ